MSSLATARTSLAAALFPASTGGLRWRSWRRTGLAAVLVLAVAGIQLLRLPGAASVTTVWAEDGAVFLHDAKTQGGIAAAFHSYNGYLHLAPRVVAALVAAFPLPAAAALLGVISALVVGLVALLVFVASREHVPSPGWRLALCGVIAFMPIAGIELLDNAANLHWYLMIGAFWALLWRPHGLGAKTVQFAVCFLAAASDPLSALLLPLVVLRLGAKVSPRDHAPSAGLAAGLLLQLLLGAASPHATTHAGLGLLGRLYGLRVALPAIVGDHGTRSLFTRAGWAPVYVAVAALVVAAILWVAWQRRGSAWLVLACAITSVAMFAVPVELRWDPAFVPVPGSTAHLEYASRFMMLPIFVVWTAVICALGGRWRRPGGIALQRIVGGAVVAAAVAVWIVDFMPSEDLRGGAPRWSASLASARANCGGLPPSATVPVTIAPVGWTVLLPCSDVGAG
jgi:hypothetical protein